MSRARFLLASALLAVLVVAGIEVVLRVSGFTYRPAPLVLRFGYPDPQEIRDLFEVDPRLFWRFRPDTVFEAEATVRINSGGYRGPVPTEPRPPDLLRVAVMGDSVAFGSAVAWPELLGDRLAGGIENGRVEVLNFGVPGYSVVQGFRQFEDDVAALRPDVVLVAYGWNDHWLARGGLPDHEREGIPPAPSGVAASASRLRTVQAVQAMLGRFRTEPAGSTTVRRVPPEVFVSTLDELIESVRLEGGVPVVIGLPSGLVEEAVPEYLVGHGFIPHAAQAIHDHRRYLDLARNAAESRNVSFVDLDRRFRTGTGNPESELFTKDRIHLSPAGHARAAEALEEAVLDALAMERGR